MDGDEPRTPTPGPGERFGRSEVLVVGVDRYQAGIVPLQTAVGDAEAIADVLAKDHGFHVVERLVDERASGDAVLGVIESEWSHRLGADDRAIVYIASHGVAIDADDGPDGYVLLHDAVRGDVSTYLSMRRLRGAIEALPCRHVLVILDCCFAGAFRWASVRELVASSGPIHRERLDRYVESPAWQALTSTASDQLALDVLTTRGRTDRGHSPFAEALLDGLAGEADLDHDGLLTATELYLYVRDRVESATDDGRLQSPGLFPLPGHRRGEFVFQVPGAILDLPPAPALTERNNPYRGLEPYGTQHAELFFGREALVDRLVQFLGEHALTVVTGPSGIGKSSLVRAGLVPRLQGEPGWMLLGPVVPGRDPLSVVKTLERGLARVSEHARECLVVVDQLDELLSQDLADAAIEDFIGALLRWARLERVTVLVTIRADLEPLLQREGSEEEWKAGRFVVPGMTQDELREAIEGPAEARELIFEPASLVDRLINEVVLNPGALPLLSFSLRELYRRCIQSDRGTRAMIESDYVAIGGVRRALTSRATEIYEALREEDRSYSLTVRRMMLRLVASPGGELARRRVSPRELRFPGPGEDDRVEEAKRRFLEARLLVTDRDPEDYIEPAHDELVRSWDVLQQWYAGIDEDRNLLEAVARAARDWRDGGQQRGLLWDDDPRLVVLMRPGTTARALLNVLEVEFVEASEKRRIRRRLLIRSVTLGVITSLSIAFVITQRALEDTQEALEDKQEALEDKQEALEDKQQELLNREMSFFASEALRQWDEHEKFAFKALEAALEAVARLQNVENLSGYPLPAHRVLRSMLDQLAVPSVTLRHTEALAPCAAIAPDGRTVVVARQEEPYQLEVFALGDGREQPLHSIAIPTSCRTLEFSPDGRRIIAGLGSEIVVFDPVTGVADVRCPYARYVGTLSVAGDVVVTGTAAHSERPDGDRFVVEGWRLDTGKTAWTMTHDAFVEPTVALSADGEHMAFVDEPLSGDERLWIFDAAKGAKHQVIWSGPKPRVMALRGGTVAVTREESGIEVWNVQPPELILKNSMRTQVLDLELSPDGRRMAASGWDHTARMWDLENDAEVGRATHEDVVWRVAMHDEGLVTVDGSGRTHRWRARSELGNRRVGTGVRRIRPSPDRRTLLMVRDDGASLLDATTGDARWSVTFPDPNRPGIRPRFGEREVLFDEHGILIARHTDLFDLDPRTGRLDHWTLQTPPERSKGQISITDVARSRDGRHQAIATGNGVLVVRDLQRGHSTTLILDTSSGSDHARWLSFHPERPWLVFGRLRSAELTLLDISGLSEPSYDLEQVPTASIRRLGTELGSGPARFLPDGTLLSTTPERVLRQWRCIGFEGPCESIATLAEHVVSFEFDAHTRRVFVVASAGGPGQPDQVHAIPWNTQIERLQSDATVVIEARQSAFDVHSSADGDFVLFTGEGGLVAWDVTRGLEYFDVELPDTTKSVFVDAEAKTFGWHDGDAVTFSTFRYEDLAPRACELFPDPWRERAGIQALCEEHWTLPYSVTTSAPSDEVVPLSMERARLCERASPQKTD